MGRKVIESKFKFFYSEVVRVRSFVYCNDVCKSGLSLKFNSNETLQWDTRGFNGAFSHWIPFFVQFTEQMSKLNGLGKTYRKCICTRTINFSSPFTTSKLLERIQILNEWKFHRLIQL